MSSDIAARLGARVRSLRKRAGLTLAELSALAEIDPGFLHYIEAGKKTPSLETLSRLSAALDVPVPELFDEARPARVAEPADARLERQMRALLRGKSASQKQDLLEILKSLRDPERAKALRRFIRP